MSLGFISVNEVVLMAGTPSITIKGSIPLTEEAPLIRKLTFSSPGLDELRVMTNPGVLPCNARAGLPVAMSAKTSDFTCSTEPVKVSFFAVP